MRASEETAIALMDFGHGGGVEVLVWVEFPKNGGVGGDRGKSHPWLNEHS